MSKKSKSRGSFVETGTGRSKRLPAQIQVLDCNGRRTRRPWSCQVQTTGSYRYNVHLSLEMHNAKPKTYTILASAWDEGCVPHAALLHLLARLQCVSAFVLRPHHLISNSPFSILRSPSHSQRRTQVHTFRLVIAPTAWCSR